MNLSITKTFGEDRIRTVLGRRAIAQPQINVQSDYKYGKVTVTPMEIMVWLHKRLLKLEGK